MGSTRLPGKILMKAAGRSLLTHHLGRLQLCQKVDTLVLATTREMADDQTVEEASALGVKVYRGSVEDVLSRYFDVAVQEQADVVVRVTADCPLIDPRLVDGVIMKHLEARPSVVYTALDISRCPRGLDTEVMERASLEVVAAEATRSDQREHVTRALIEDPVRFPRHFHSPSRTVVGTTGAGWRWCVDEPADFELIRRMLEALIPEKPQFGWEDCLDLLVQNPEWAKINSTVVQK
jgi:spore coat polysaccharide biosynthesis protein SpsF